MRFTGRLAPGGDEGHAHGARRPLSWNLLAVLHLRPSRLAIIVSPWEFGPALTSYRTYRRISNSPQTTPIVRSRFLDRTHYNEFVDSGAKSWALMRRRPVLGMKTTQNRAAQCPREKGPLARGWDPSLPFILLLHLSVIHAYPQMHVPSAILSSAL